MPGEETAVDGEAPEPLGPPRMMTGNEACAEAALAAGLDFFAGYPITPSTEIAEILADALPRVGGRFLQMEDEIASVCAILGASLAGARSMTATSGPGFSLMQEALGFGGMAEVTCVIALVMRGGPSTGLPTLPAQGDVMQTRWGTHGDHPAVVLCPRSVAETWRLTVRAFNLAEELRMPVILLLDEMVAHTSEKVRLPERVRVVRRGPPDAPPGRLRPYAETPDDVPPRPAFGEGWRFHVTGLAHDETGFPTHDPALVQRLLRRLHRKVDRRESRIVEVEEDIQEGADVAVVSYGSTARAVARGVSLAREEGARVSRVSLLTLWPFPAEALRRLARGTSRIIVAELNLAQVAHEVEWAVAGAARVERLAKVGGEAMRPSEVLEAIRGGAAREETDR